MKHVVAAWLNICTLWMQWSSESEGREYMVPRFICHFCISAGAKWSISVAVIWHNNVGQETGRRTFPWTFHPRSFRFCWLPCLAIFHPFWRQNIKRGNVWVSQNGRIKRPPGKTSGGIMSSEGNVPHPGSSRSRIRRMAARKCYYGKSLRAIHGSKSTRRRKRTQASNY